MVKIFLSYCYKNKTEADYIDSFFQANKYSIMRDIREVGFKGDLHKYCAKIRECQAAVTLISDDYLKSRWCMYEVLQLMKEQQFENKIFPVPLDDAGIFNALNRTEYIKYWNKEFNRLEAEAQGLEPSQIAEIALELKLLAKIKLDVGTFTTKLGSWLLPKYDTLKQTDFRDIIDAINKLFSRDKTSDKPKGKTGKNISPRQQSTILRILCLSNLQYKVEEKRGDQWAVDAFNKNIAARELVRKVAELTMKGTRVHLIIIAGDIAYSGKEDEYQVASIFCDQLLNAAQLNKQNLFMVAGNHDVDRNKIEELLMPAFYPPDSQEKITKILLNETFRSMLLSKLTAFHDFANKNMAYQYLSANNYAFAELVPVTIDQVQWDINIAGLNSALFAGYNGDDQQKLAMGLCQVDQVINKIENTPAHLGIAFFHHPFDCMHGCDKVSRSRLIQKMGLFFNGHIHTSHTHYTQESITPAGRAIILGAGTACRPSNNVMFQLIELDMWSYKGKAYYYKYLPEHNIWKIDHDINPTTNLDHFPFSLNITPIIHAVNANNKIIPPKYLNWLYDTCAYLDIRGIITVNRKAYKPHISQFYIPLKTKSIDQKQGANGNVMKEFQQSIELDETLQFKRLVIIGDPGTGKTTYLRRIAFLLCRRLLHKEDAETKWKYWENQELLPLFIRISELTEHIYNSDDGPSEKKNPQWLLHYMENMNRSLNLGFPRGMLKSWMESGQAVFLLDGLDEAPDKQKRTAISILINNAITAWDKCRFIITTRPYAYRDNVVLSRFKEVIIAPLQDKAVEKFLYDWVKTLHQDISINIIVDNYYKELLTALKEKPEIKRLATNPVMLTAIAVVHWNERKLPEGRVMLYDRIISWLLNARDQRPGRIRSDTCKMLLQTLALAMQMYSPGRLIQIDKREAAEKISKMFEGNNEADQIRKAGTFLEEEQIDSGIIVSRGNKITFWHLTFQEYLAAKALGGELEREQQRILIRPEVLYNPDWREVLLLFGGVLHEQGINTITGFLHAILAYVQGNKNKKLEEKARCAGLLGLIIKDLSDFNYKFQEPYYQEMLNQVMIIFEKGKANEFPVHIRESVAEALGQAGDPRFDKKFITIPACTFWMGAQNENSYGRNYAQLAIRHESPIHEVTLSLFKISRYPVTVGEFRQFINARGYTNSQYWEAGGYGKFQEPENWNMQVVSPIRPVTGISWYEAMAYACWAELDLPTEAQWERVARGETEYRLFPWGNSDPDEKMLNFGDTGLDHPSPVGIFPDDQTLEGVFDISSNVSEWCKDYKDVESGTSEFYNISSGSTDPYNGGLITGNIMRVIRGASWGMYARGILRCSARLQGHPEIRTDQLGFRVVNNNKERRKR